MWLAQRSDGASSGKLRSNSQPARLPGAATEERFKREGSILGRLTHPHIAELLDAGISCRWATISRPRICRRVDRSISIATSSKLDVEARVRLFLDVMSAVAHAHANLIVHRDIKPSNVLVRTRRPSEASGLWHCQASRGRRKPAGCATLLTHEGGAALTPQFAAPEQLTGAASHHSNGCLCSGRLAVSSA